MLLDKRRASFAATAVLAVSMLAGCAVPGQGDPGTAAQWGDTTISLADVQSYQDGLADLGFEGAPAGVALTLALIDEPVVSEAEAEGSAWSDDELTEFIGEWLTALDADGEVTDDSLEVARIAWSLTALVSTDEGAEFIQELAVDIEENSTASVRFGDFSADYFYSTSLASQASAASSYVETYGEGVYMLLAGVTGYESSASDAEWFGSPDAVPSASASASE